MFVAFFGMNDAEVRRAINTENYALLTFEGIENENYVVRQETHTERLVGGYNGRYFLFPHSLVYPVPARQGYAIPHEGKSDWGPRLDTH